MNPASAGRLSEAAASLGARLEDGTLSAERVRLKGPLNLRRLTIDELIIESIAGDGPFVLTDCRIRSVRMRNVLIRDGLLFEDCEFGRLDVRGAHKVSLSVVRTSALRTVLHECGSITIDTSNLGDSLTVSDAQRSVEVTRSSTSLLAITAEGPGSPEFVRLRDIVARDRIQVSNIDVGQIEGSELSTAQIHLRNIRSDVVSLRRMSIDRELLVQGLAAGMSGACEIVLSGHMGELSLESAGERPVRARVDDATVRGDMTLRGRALAVCFVGGTVIDGMLSVGSAAHRPMTSIDETSVIRRIAPPDEPIRRPRDAVRVATEVLGGAGRRELAVLRDSLMERPEQQDVAYFALRSAERQSLRGARRVGSWLGQNLFGWGVSFLQPIRTLAGGILATAVAVAALGPREGGSVVASCEKSLTTALGLWFNVTLGMPASLSTPIWTLAGVTCTALGITFVTVMSGVAIRRLTR